MAKVPYSVETLPKISIVWVGRTNVTDRQTDDRQTTDGRTTTYSEHELEFTFAKNGIVKTSETLIFCSVFCYTAGSVKSDAIEGMPDQLLKRVAMVFRVHWTGALWHIDSLRLRNIITYLLTYIMWIAVDLLILIINNDYQFWGNCV